MEVNLIDGTYELFRHFHAMPSAQDHAGQEVAAVRGVLASLLGMMQAGETHIGVATDHVIESFRNRMWPGYKTGQGFESSLLSQFLLLEERFALSAWWSGPWSGTRPTMLWQVAQPPGSGSRTLGMAGVQPRRSARSNRSSATPSSARG